MTDKELRDMTPVEIDTLLLPIWTEMGRQEWVAMMAHLEIKEAKADLAKYTNGEYLAGLNDYERKYHVPDTIERAEKKIAEAEATLEAVRATMAKLHEEEAPYHAEFKRRGGWYRYYIVLNSNGHVHRGTNCTTCFPTTRYGWIVKLSGCDETVMVDEYGEMACTVCFPDAPTMAGWAASIARKEAEEAATRCPEIWPEATNNPRYYRRYGDCKCGARAVALTPNGKLRTHKTPEMEAAEAARKATFGHPDGKKLKDVTGRRAQKTPKGAFNALREGLRIKEGFDAGNPHPYYVGIFKPAEIDRLAEALALYNGTTAEEEIAKAIARNADEDEAEMRRRAADIEKRMRRAR